MLLVVRECTISFLLRSRRLAVTLKRRGHRAVGEVASPGLSESTKMRGLRSLATPVATNKMEVVIGAITNVGYGNPTLQRIS